MRMLFRIFVFFVFSYFRIFRIFVFFVFSYFSYFRIFRIFRIFLNFADLIIIQNLNQFHVCSPQKLGQPVKLREEFFIQTAGSSVSMCSFILEKNVI